MVLLLVVLLSGQDMAREGHVYMCVFGTAD